MSGEQRDTYIDFMDIWFALKNDRMLLLEELQSRFLLDEKIFRKRNWSFAETILAFYGISPFELLEPHIGITGGLILDPYISELIQLIDQERIYDLLWDSVPSEVCPSANRVTVDKFLPFLQARKIPIPDHLTCYLGGKISMQNSHAEDMPCVDSSSPSNEKARLDRRSFRKTIARHLALGFWQREKLEIGNKENKKKQYTSSHALARDERMQTIIKNVDELFGIDHVDASQCESDCIVDPEWFSDLHPDPSQKRGRKRIR